MLLPLLHSAGAQRPGWANREGQREPGSLPSSSLVTYMALYPAFFLNIYSYNTSKILKQHQVSPKPPS